MSPLSTCPAKPSKQKVGADGLTRSQRYYKNHPEIKTKNRERAREVRRRKKETAGLLLDAGDNHVQRDPSNISPTSSPGTSSRLSGMSNFTTDNIPARMEYKKLPRDFFTMRQQNRDAALGHAIQVLQDSRFEDSIAPGTQALDRASKLRHAVLEWAAGWGGVAYWEIGLHRSYMNAVEEGTDKEWREKLLNHASLGRRLLAQYTNLQGALPTDAYMIKELWRVTVEMVEILVMGITIINTRCSILPHLWQVDRIPTPAWSNDESEGSVTDGLGEADQENETGDDKSDSTDEEGKCDGGNKVTGLELEDRFVDPERILALEGDDS